MRCLYLIQLIEQLENNYREHDFEKDCEKNT